MIDRFARFPAALASRARHARLGPSNIPAMIAHPDWQRPAPVVLWLHGRTASKELDPGRYLRWVRAGLAACAIDLPGHGERHDDALTDPRRTPDLLAQAIAEIDHVLAALAQPPWSSALDLRRSAIGGMSAGGMAALRRLCDDHPFTCAAVEAAAGSLADLYMPDPTRPPRHPPERLAPLDPIRNLDRWRPIPLLAVHSQADRLVPLGAMSPFLDALRARYAAIGADPGLIQLLTFPQTGAPEEHLGFGRYSNDAKNAQTAFLRRHLLPEPRP